MLIHGNIKFLKIIYACSLVFIEDTFRLIFREIYVYILVTQCLISIRDFSPRHGKHDLIWQLWQEIFFWVVPSSLEWQNLKIPVLNWTTNIKGGNESIKSLPVLQSKIVCHKDVIWFMTQHRSQCSYKREDKNDQE